MPFGLSSSYDPVSKFQEYLSQVQSAQEQGITSYGNLINSLKYTGNDSFFSQLIQGEDLYKYLQERSLGSPELMKEALTFFQSLFGAANSGDWLGVQGALAGKPGALNISPELEKYVDNMIAKQNTLQNQSWEEQQASTNLLKAGSQLESLGLSASGVLQTGGSNVNGVNSAQNSFTNLSQQMKLQKYTQRMAMARQLLGMTSQMAAAGIYGGALGAAKSASSALTSAASHSALGALSKTKGVKRSKALQSFIDESSALDY